MKNNIKNIINIILQSLYIFKITLNLKRINKIKIKNDKLLKKLDLKYLVELSCKYGDKI